MTVFKLTITVAHCDAEGCEAADDVPVAHFPDAVKKLRDRGWWITKTGGCLCPTHGRHMIEQSIQRQRDGWERHRQKHQAPNVGVDRRA